MATALQGPRLQIAGDRQSGQDVRTQNVMAVTAVANIVKSSLGPVGLDKVRCVHREPARNVSPELLGAPLKVLGPARRCWWTTLVM